MQSSELSSEASGHVSENIPVTDKRLRTLTERGTEMYESHINKHRAELEHTRKCIDEVLDASIHIPDDIATVCKIESDLDHCFNNHCRASGEYMKYLMRTNTLLSLKETDRHNEGARSLKLTVQDALLKLSKHKQVLLERKSSIDTNSVTSKSTHRRSTSSHSTSASNISSIRAKKRAKAAAARKRVEFATKEAELHKQQALLDAETIRKRAVLDADLEIIAHEKEAAAAEAEVAALQSDSDHSSDSFVTKSHISHNVDSLERTQQYVDQHSSLFQHAHTPDVNQNTDTCININTVDSIQPADHAMPPAAMYNTPYSARPILTDTAHSVIGDTHANHTCMPDSVNSRPPDNYNRNNINTTLDPNAPTFYVDPRGYTHTDSHIPNHIARSTNGNHGNAESHLKSEREPDVTSYTNPQHKNDQSRLNSEYHANAHKYTGSANHAEAYLTRFLLKKELVFSRLTRYNDRPETYAVWKSSFLSVTTELNVSPTEELDLLVKWLGPESGKHATSIRASNVNDPSRGLQRLWDRLDDRYGCAEMVEASLKSKLARFPKLTSKDSEKLYELSDILSEIESVKEDKRYHSLLSYYDSSSGVNPIVSKLPYPLQDKWTNRAVDYKRRHGVSFPPFTVFSEFVRDMSKVKNDPSFMYEPSPNSSTKQDTRPKSRFVRQTVATKKTEVKQSETHVSDLINVCPLHKTKHSLNKCRTFKAKTIEQRWKLLRDNKICFRCCNSYTHMKPACRQVIRCDDCGSDRHSTAMHVDNYQGRSTANANPTQPPPDHGGEPTETVSSKCTQICGSKVGGKSCAKMVLVNVYPDGHPEDAIKTYAILDEQSNRSLAKTELFDDLDIHGQEIEYTLASCAGTIVTSGRRAGNCIVESIDGSARLQLPTVIECNQIPEVREEIPSPEIAEHYPHLSDITNYIPPVEDGTPLLLLIGRDLPEAHHVLDQRIGLRNTPYAQRLNLGWVIVGETCLGKVHKPQHVNVNKTHLLTNGRTTIFEPCRNNLEIKDHQPCSYDKYVNTDDKFTDSIFDRTKHDNKPGMSIDDNEFIEIMDGQFRKNSLGNWEAPLPFRTPRQRLTNNRSQAIKRAKTLDSSLRKDPNKKEHFMNFMQGVLDNKHAELAPPLTDDEERWYLPIFGVYHPRKPNQIRAVFDSSAKHNGISLNDVLLTGPDMTNSLLGVLLRFRKESVAATTDVQQMFHCFYVREDHRNFLRFLWYKDNNMDNDLVEYRMCVHVFGNAPSPAIATYGLRKTAEASVETFGQDVKAFVEHDFYVDDGLASRPTAPQLVDLLKRTKNALQSEGNLRLHKIASNDDDVMKAFPTSDLAKDLQQLYLDDAELPLQRSLGLIWDINSDSFTFRVSREQKPYSRRGLLSTVNSLFDPLGFVAPVTIHGKLILRDLVSEGQDWDEPLPTDCEQQWTDWRNSLSLLEYLHIPRTYSSSSLSDCTRKEIHIFSDASEKAIAAVAYLKTTSPDGSQQLGFILGKAKVAPKHGHTIPRLELCAAVLAIEIAETITDQIGIKADIVKFYTDSKVVLGYINNRTRRFFVYVANRVDKIRRSSKPEQWGYVSTNKNPADSATRPTAAANIESSPWLVGPTYLLDGNNHEHSSDTEYQLCSPDEDKEVTPTVEVLKTTVSRCNMLGSHRFERFSRWTDLVQTIVRRQHIANCFRHQSECKGWHTCSKSRSVDASLAAEHTIIRAVQQEVFGREILAITENRPLPRDSQLLSLNPVIDKNGLLCVGGRLNRADLSVTERNPVIIPSKHHLGTLLIRHHHEKVEHQGRHFTEGAVRSAGYWIIGCKRKLSLIIHKCVKCRKLRGKFESQKMSDLPVDRITPGPAFTSVGVDTFGPWSIITRRTRGGQANSKRWAILFTCLTTRAIHIEVVEDMSTSSFINALRRFVAIRGNVKEFRSDRGTNFIGAIDKLNITAINVEDGPMEDYLYKNGAVWIFNPPHASHMGGVWERMIGVTRRILDSLLTNVAAGKLTHEVLVTLMAEVTAIVNARPLVPVSSDPECPEILSPAMLLTGKTNTTSALGEFDMKDLYKAQWRSVQALADHFWSRWRREYLHTLQIRHKWHDEHSNIKLGDVILLVDDEVCRNDWPVGVIVNPLPSDDGKVRKAEVRVMRDGKPTVYTRPVTKMVLLLSDI
ncbi:MAG: hypothetical protein ABW185_18100 [Sedimenticola sp.]